ncbi:C69 family dipeptidase [Phenylobacterium sp. SCN 70-31]|uniref:C69 family dipeptidase n=1 Tax=Phenylobacterium sp. SCN 70-31 TaxID=1660129 RepID=UPI00086D7FA3|nr:C69 family dipeptidase [Phenylobacterium sp. SCN 70-31]ODT86936.1 MAG: hypothetical protein ABS78_13800 [Phenylobacterium sp. SCN 70-31]
MCDTLVSLAPSTTRGATLFAKNSDRERNEAQGLELSPARSGPAGAPLRLTYITIPDVARTHACLLSRPFWMWGAEMGANDRGVVIGNEALHARVPAQRRRALTGMDLVRLGLERGGTAREALEVIVGLLEAHGQGGDCGHLGRFYYHNGFIVADPAEAYVLETVGRDWVWRQVEDRRALSNAYSIADDYDALSPGLARAGRYDVAASLIDEARDSVSFGRGRCARGQALLDRAAPALAPATMRAILRDHGDAPDWSPAHTRDRTICMHASCGPRRSQSVASMVSELRPDRAVHWVTGTSAPCVSLFKPFVFGAATPPFGPSPTDRADTASLWWRHEALHRAALPDFTAALAAIAPERDALEAEFQAQIDASPAGEALDAAIAACWAEAEAAEARWRRTLAPSIREPARHRASWARLNHVAGFTV